LIEHSGDCRAVGDIADAPGNRGVACAKRIQRRLVDVAHMNSSAFASECTRCREADAGRAGRDEDTQSADREIHVEPSLVAERIAQSQIAAALNSTTVAAWTATALWDYNCIAFRRAAPNGRVHRAVACSPVIPRRIHGSFAD
jgi:hypothetical protein